MNIRLAETGEEILACFPVMQVLRPHLVQEAFLPRILEQRKQGYQLVYLQLVDRVLAVAGFRIGENLAWGRFLYVDDLVTHPDHRSHGYGSALLTWLKSHAAGKGCGQLHLDSGSQRIDAHRFYEREAMNKAGFHFAIDIKPGKDD